MSVDRKIQRIQAVILPVLRAEMPHVTFNTWIPNPTFREFPLVNIRRLGGTAKDVYRLDRPVVEITAYSRDGVAATEDIYLDVRTVLRDMVRNQVVTEHGYLTSFFETFGPTLFDSPLEDVFRVQGLIALGLRPPPD